jgi:hypothetical protein
MYLVNLNSRKNRYRDFYGVDKAGFSLLFSFPEQVKFLLNARCDLRMAQVAHIPQPEISGSVAGVNLCHVTADISAA